MNYHEILDKITKFDIDELMEFLFLNHLIYKEMNCDQCNVNMILKKLMDRTEKHSWRCMNTKCSKYKSTISIRKGSFFEGFLTPIRILLKVYIYWISKEQRYKIISYSGISQTCYNRFHERIVGYVSLYNQKNPPRFGGPGIIVQVDETMLSHPVKSHRGRAPKKQIWALTIVDTSHKPALGYAEIIENKSSGILIPIIQKIVIPGSIIHTDEHKSYGVLTQKGYLHDTVCHKYNFKDPITGVHTQHVESYNNRLKLEIKKRKGIKSGHHQDSLLEIVWQLNHSNCKLETLFSLIHVNK